MSAKSDDEEALATAGASVTSTDPFESLLRDVAHVSGTPAARRGPALVAGAVLAAGRLSIVRKVGEGGMGVVYEAFDAQRKGRVACKTLSRREASSVYRLKNEFRALADVTHPNLVRLHELFAEDEAWFFTMELVDGERFDRWVRPNGLDEQRLRAALPQLLAAMSAIHGANKLHRDLKPSNVLVTPEGRVVVLDFGLAIDPELGGVGQTIAEDSVSGTPGYMAPEQAAGQSATAASDFYALGAMLFEALTGKLPFEGRAHEMLVDKQRSDAPRAGALAAGLPADLEALCAELLAREPAARPDAAAVYARLGLRGAPDVRLSGPPVAAEPELLGREPELRALREAFAATQQGRPVVLFVAGESGMGKSALYEAFADELRAQHRATVLAGRCHERENVPFKGFDALVDDLSRYLRRLSGEEAAAVLPREAYALARIFPVLGRIAVVAAAPTKDVADPQDLKRRAFDAFGELLARMRDRAPLVLLLDDVQWLDQDSVRFMRALLVQPEPVPLLLVCAHRSEGALDNALLQSVRQGAHDNARLDVRELQIGALPQAALATLAHRLLPAGALALTAQALATEAQGSPFFAGELARAVAALGPDQPAPSLAEALSLHIGALPPAARKILSLVALAGQPLPVDVVLDAARAEDAHAGLDQLRAEQLVRVSLGQHGQRAIECYHDKIREQLAAALDARAAAELALALAQALQADADASSELLARLLLLAGKPVEAADHFVRAADAARAALAFDHAAELYAQALEHGAFAPERMQALRVARADALAYAGRSATAAKAYLLATEHAAPIDAAELECQAGEQYLICGDLAPGRELFDRALRRVGHSLPKSLAGAFAGVLWSRVRLRLRGLSFTPRAQHDAATLRELELLRVAVSCFVRSDQLRAVDFSARYVMRALDSGHAVEAARALAFEVLLRSLTNAPLAQVDAAAALCSELCEQTGDQLALAWFLHCRGTHSMIRLGRHDEALIDFDRAIVLNVRGGFRTAVYDRGWTECFRATALWMNGRIAEAGELALAALEEALARGDYTVSGTLVQIVAYGLLAGERTEQAERVLEEARTWLPEGEIAVQHMNWLASRYSVGVYAGDPIEAWHATAELRARFLGSWQGRSVMAGPTRSFFAGIAVCAARAVDEPVARRALEREARRLARGAPSQAASLEVVPRDALLACMDGDRERAIAELRLRIPSPHGALITQIFRRRLGELLADAEGAMLVAEADAFLRKGGVIDPARFTAAFAPGIEIR